MEDAMRISNIHLNGVPERENWGNVKEAIRKEMATNFLEIMLP